MATYSAFIKCFAVAGAMGVASSALAETTVLMEDDFESYDKTAALIGGDWEEQKFYWGDAACTQYLGEYPAWGDGGPVAAQNVNFQTQQAQGGPYGEYTKQGLSDNTNNVAGTLGLEVRQDTYGTNNDACTTHRVFKRFDSSTLESGNYKISGRAMISEYFGATSLPAGAAVGVFLTIQNAADNSIVINEYRDVTVSQSSVTTIAEDFAVNVGSVTNFNVTVGMFSRNEQGAFGGAIFDDFKLSVGGLTEEEIAENEACNDTSVLRFEDPFGGAKVTCLTDTYEMPADAEEWAGFGDTKRGDYYPFFFPVGGSITMDCSTASGTTQLSFVFEEAPDPFGLNPGQPKLTVGPATCGATESTQTINIPVSEQPWGNLIMYIGDKTRAAGSPPVIASNITVNGSREYVPPPIPTPTVPVWGLLALTGLVGFMGLRRRRK